MLYSRRSKFNRQEIKIQLIKYLEGLYTDIKVVGPYLPGHYFTHIFSGVDIKTGVIRYFKVTYRKTEKRSRTYQFHTYSVEYLTLNGYWKHF